MERRFGDRARIEYLDITREEVRSAYGATVAELQENGLIYPVTVIDGRALYDGAVSYPAILRAVDSALTAQTA